MNPTRILFIGNSFTNRNDLPGLLTTLASAMKPAREVITHRVIANGMALKTHWNRGEAKAAISDQKWDYVVLQEQSTLPLKNPSRMHESIRLFDQAIKASGARTVLYLTWARLSVFEKQDELSDAYLTIGRELRALVVPVGIAWQHMLAKHPQVVLHDRDGSHPNLIGSYLAACVFAAALFGKSPVGLPPAPGVNPSIATQLQQAADAACAQAGIFG